MSLPALICALLALACGCGDATTSSSLEATGADGGAADAPQRMAAAWRYRSAEVDVDIDLVTSLGAGACVTTAELRVDEAIAGTERYHLPETDCSTLRLTAAGDLVLYDAPTGHDWASEAIDVDTNRERIRLGPWYDEQAELTYRFTLAAPECQDDSDCDCPELVRSAGTETLRLALGRRCD
jgi:hypothetical protein